MEFSYIKVKSVYYTLENRKIEMFQKSNVSEVTEKEIEQVENLQTNDVNVEEIWQIEIPKINLIAPIAEGTSQEVMLEYVGHFENTEILNGNIGFAAHNRGYPINYFARIKELEIGDKIIYKIKNDTKEYSINLSTIIEDTDWSYLQETNENKITLITCVENEPSKRRCIQGIEVEEE